MASLRSPGRRAGGSRVRRRIPAGSDVTIALGDGRFASQLDVN